MHRDVLQRGRWGNVAVACVTFVCLAAVIVWPGLAPRAPRLPTDAPQPLLGRTERPASGGAGPEEAGGRPAASSAVRSRSAGARGRAGRVDRRRRATLRPG